MLSSDRRHPPSKREQRRDDRRAAILNVARECFLEHGFNRTTMSAIAERLGGSKGTLWSYFESKAALFEAVIDDASARLRTELTDALDQEGDIGTVLRHFAGTFIRKISSPEAIALQRMVIGESGQSPELSQIFYRRTHVATRELLSVFIHSSISGGRLKPSDESDAAQVLIGLCAGGHHKRLLWNIDRLNEQEIERDAENAVRHFLAILSAVTRD